MKTDIVFVKSMNVDVDSREFFARATATPDLNRDFMFARMDATAIKDVLQDRVTEHGISSLFNYQITCDAVMHPGIMAE